MVQFVMHDAYLREFHEEMVDTRLHRWRFHQRFAKLAMALSLVGAVAAVWSGRIEGGVFAGVMGLMGAAMVWRLHQRRERWLAYQRRLPTFGARVTTVLDRGRLIQSSDKNSDVLGIPTGEVLESRRGWFVTYDIVHLGNEVTDEAVNTERSSAYLPKSGFDPGVTPDAFAAELSTTFKVKLHRSR